MLILLMLSEKVYLTLLGICKFIYLDLFLVNYKLLILTVPLFLGVHHLLQIQCVLLFGILSLNDLRCA